MPFGDGTGPAGMGPMTGRMAGYCAGYGMPGYMNPIGGRGFWGRGRGGGRGFRRWFRATGLPGWLRAGYGYPVGPGVGQQMTSAQEIEMLKNQAEYFKESLEDITEQIKELENRQADKK